MISSQRYDLRGVSASKDDVHNAIKTVFSYGLRLKNLPVFEPKAEPITTMGASKPDEPPKPTVKELVAK